MNVSFLDEVQDELTSDDLVRLAEMVKLSKAHNEAIEAMKDSLAKVEEQQRLLLREQIPELLMSKGLRTIELLDGTKVQVQEKVSANFPRKDLVKKKAVLDWLIANGGASIIDNEVIINEPEKFVLDYLKEKKVPIKRNIDVHHQRFVSFIRDKLGLKKNTLPEIEASDVPEEANLYIYNETKIKE